MIKDMERKQKEGRPRKQLTEEEEKKKIRKRKRSLFQQSTKDTSSEDIWRYV